MQPDDVLRPPGRRRDAVDVLVRGIRRKYCALPADGVELPEYFLLEFEVFEHGLYDEVGVGQRLVVRRTGNAPAVRERLIFAHLAALHAPLVIAIDDPEALAEHFVVHFE